MGSDGVGGPVLTTQSKDSRARLVEEAIRRKRAAPRSSTAQLARRPADRDASLGEMQRGIWMQHQLEPSSPAYHLASAFRVPGVLNVPELERSLNGVVSRHRILRSTFRAGRESVQQIVQAAVSIEVERLSASPGEALSAAAREARKPFDLGTGPVIRLLLVEEPEGSERLLVLVLHHILADERSLESRWGELAEGYDGRAVDDAERPQYDDFVYWMAGRDGRQRAADLAYWREQLQPPPDDLMLPFESPAHKAPSARGRLLSRAVGADVGRQIRTVASATGTTPFMVLTFAFRLLLHRYTQGRRIAFATPVSRRSHPAAANMIGYFLNPVVICAQIDEQRCVEDAIRDFSDRMRDSVAHASVPFDVLVEELSPPRRRGRHPLFQSMFVYQERPLSPQLGGVRLEPVALDLGESKFDLTLFALQRAGSIEMAVEYRADRFDEVWMQNLLGHYSTLVAHLEEGLGRAVADLPMLGPGENDEPLSTAQGAPSGAAQSVLLPQQILDQAARSAQAPAVIGADAEWSYAALEAVGRRIAAALLRCGVQPGSRVGLLLDRSPLMIAGILGSHWAGAAYVPLDPDYPSARNNDVLEDAEVSAVLTRKALLDRVPAGSTQTIAVDDLAAPAEFPDPVLPTLHNALPAYILYTSGSTGRPKGVVVTHDNLRASTGARRQVYDSPPKRFLLLPSVAFDSSVAGIFWTLAAGGALIIPSDDEARDPRRLAQLVAEQRVTMLLCVPSLYAQMLRAGGDLLQGLETVIVAGESCPAQLVEEHFRRLPQAHLFNEYGPTEATVWATVHKVERQDGGRPVAIGRPIPGVRIDVLDELGRRTAAGVPGEAWISGPTVAQGYWRRPELTDERFISRTNQDGSAQRMFRSGDRMAWTADGRLLFLGRVDEQIKLRGFRIEPGEIESVLLESPDVEEAAVVARDSEQLVAFVVTSGAVEDYRDELVKRLPEFMVPGRFVKLAELPRLPNGKVDRQRLREIELEPGAPADPSPRILNDREHALVSLWEGLLGQTGIGLTDNFFQLGGHSLLVVEMTLAIERHFGITLAPAELFQNPTIQELAGRMEQEEGPRSSVYAHLFPIEPGGRKTPFIFCIPHFFAGMVAARFRGERPVYGLRGVGLRPEGNRGRWRNMRELGEELVEEICRRFPDQPIIVAGYSFGATMAVEAVRLMEERGISVERLYLIAPMPVDSYRLGPFRVQIDGLDQPVEELSLRQALGRFAADNHPLTLRPYRRAWRLLAVRPWRILLCLAGRVRVLAGKPLTPRILYADVRLERFRLHTRYRPGIVRTPTVIFNAQEPATDAAATWRPYFKGPLIVHEIPDPHLDATSIAAAKRLILEQLHAVGDS